MVDMTMLDRMLLRCEITIHANPVHFATHRNLTFANNRNIILRLTGHEASITASASVKVDRHSPLVNLICKVSLLSKLSFRPSLAALRLV